MFSIKKIVNFPSSLIYVRNMKRNSNFKIFKVIKSMSQTKISHYLLSSTFNDKFKDLILIFYILVPNTTIKGTMKNI